MADEIGLIKRELADEMTSAQDKLFKKYDAAIRAKLTSANEFGQAAAESVIGGSAGMVIAKVLPAAELWVRKKGFNPVGSRKADFWGGLSNLALGAASLGLNAAIAQRPVPGGLRQGIRSAATVTMFMGFSESVDALVDWIGERTAAAQRELATAKQQALIAQQQAAQAQQAAKK